MNWFTKFAQQSNWRQNVDDIFTVISDTLAEKGYTNFEDPSILNMANIAPIISPIIEPQISQIAQEVISYLNSVYENPYRSQQHGTITIDDNIKIEVSTSISIEPNRVYVDLRSQSGHNVPYRWWYVGRNINTNTLTQQIYEETLRYISNIVHANSKIILNSLKETAHSTYNKNYQKSKKSKDYIDKLSLYQLLDKISTKYNSIIYPGEGFSGSYIYLNSQPNFSESNQKKPQDPSQIYLRDIIEDHIDDGNNQMFGRTNLDQGVDLHRIMSLPYPVIIHIIKYMKNFIESHARKPK